MKYIQEALEQLNSLREELLVEATIPTYREILLLLIGQLTDNADCKKLLSNKDNLKNIFIHHIDDDYSDPVVKSGARRAKNNDYSNIAIVTSQAHNKIHNYLRSINKQINNTTDSIKKTELKAEKQKLIKSLMDSNIEGIYPLIKILPKEVLDILSAAAQEVADEGN